MKDFCDKMCKRFDVEITDKADSQIMAWAGKIVEMAADMSEEEFLKEYTTTLYNIIYVPILPWEDDPANYWSWVSTITHECLHAKQFRDEIFEFPYYYATDTAYRANKEAEALSSGAILYLIFIGDDYDPKQKVKKLGPYGCNSKDQAGAAASIQISMDNYNNLGVVDSEETKYAANLIRGYING